ncbi:MAG TPA: pyridoxamine 5'-phosphate oxidase family protein [Candidatus Dormibacteraeota bacterium]|nr:pyridoxamine 5'-phosphate oxidase family protein [Candidatus Dormibacteraeota bacterium]
MREQSLRLARIRSVGPYGSPIPAKDTSHDQVVRSLFRILRSTELCSLSTVTPEGNAHSAHVYFAYTPKLDLYFLSDPDSLHCKNLETNPSMSVSVFDSAQRNFVGPGDRGVALYGRCFETKKSEAERAEEVYAKRFKPYGAWRASPGYDKEAQRLRFYRFAASRIKVLDEPVFGSAVFMGASVRRP